MKEISQETLKEFRSELLDAKNTICSKYGLMLAEFKKGQFVVLVNRFRKDWIYFSIGQTLKIDGHPVLDDNGYLYHWCTDGYKHYNIHESQLRISDECLFMPKQLDLIKKAKSYLKVF